MAAILALAIPLGVGVPGQEGLFLPGPRARTAALVAPEALSWEVSRSQPRGTVLAQIDPDTMALETMEERLARDGEVEVSSPKGTRVWTASAMSDHDVPAAAARAYRSAAASMATSDPGCQLPWTLLAGIGRVESDHGRYAGSEIGTDGVSRPEIIGVPLNGVGPVAAIRDTDVGRLDHDTVWDRAVGPMQFIPSTWAGAARDGDGDGVMNPHDLDDAALAAAGYLCSGEGSVLGDAMSTAVYRYNQDDYYVALVIALERGYRTGDFTLPAPPAEDTARDGKQRDKDRDRDGKRDRKRDRKRDDRNDGDGKGGSAGTSDGPSSPKPGPKPDPSPSDSPSSDPTPTPKPSPTPKPDPTPSPSPSPSPSPAPSPSPSPSPTPEPVSVSGVFAACTGGYCLGDLLLDLGTAGDPAKQAAGDYDGNGTVGTNGEEIAGLLGKQTQMVVVKNSGGADVYSINGVSVS
jgi:hypothetical protein